MSRRKKHAEEHENHERWLVSYADFMTLLFAFFVVMYAVSRVDNKRLIEASNSIKWALHFEGTGGVRQLPLFTGPPSEGGCVANTGKGPVTDPQKNQVVEAYRRKLEKRLRPYLMEREATQAVTVVVEGGRLSVRLAASRFFDAGLSALRPEVLSVLDAVGEELRGLDRPVRVEGHTDDQPFSSQRYRNNWDLSAARAASVVAYLESAHGFPSALLTAEGHAATRPLVSNDTEAGREANRRIELVVEVDTPVPTPPAPRAP